MGTYWDNIPGHEHRAMCHKCQTIESMEHILLECDTPGRKTVWNLAQQLWEKKMGHWLEIKNMGGIMACTMADFKSQDGKKLGGAN